MALFFCAGCGNEPPPPPPVTEPELLLSALRAMETGDKTV